MDTVILVWLVVNILNTIVVSPERTEYDRGFLRKLEDTWETYVSRHFFGKASAKIEKN